MARAAKTSQTSHGAAAGVDSEVAKQNDNGGYLNDL